MELYDSIAGALLGTAVGDSLGLPREGLSGRRAARLFGARPVDHRFLLRRGMLSDDTEHTCMVAQSLLSGAGDAGKFTTSLAWRLRWWLLGLPAGVGRATLKSIVKLWLGFGTDRSGVFSAGNGPAMRSALLGICFRDDPDRLRSFVRASSRLTHTDPRAEEGALAVALAAAEAASTQPGELDQQSVLRRLKDNLSNVDMLATLEDVEKCLKLGAQAADLADTLGLERGVTGYVCHTVPVALFCWLTWSSDFRRAVEETICLGGDTDTTGAIVGALAGATVGTSGVPNDWLSGIADWPRSVSWMERLAGRLTRAVEEGWSASASRPLRLFWPAIPFRNALFLAVVLLHGFRRLLPPY